MAHSVDEWLVALWQVMPRGKAWSRDEDGDLNLFLRALARRLSQTEFDAENLLPEMRPETTFMLLEEWEEYLELPECGQLSGTVEDRRRAVVEKYHRKGGLSPWQIEAVAAALGFTIRVTVILPHHCMRSCMYPLYPARYRWTLQIDVIGISGGRFTCIDNVMTPLLSERARELECVLTKYRLGGTAYEYFYSSGDN
ncbi:TPA: putative phage tail protein [Citrobacter freundii]